MCELLALSCRLPTSVTLSLSSGTADYWIPPAHTSDASLLSRNKPTVAASRQLRFLRSRYEPAGCWCGRRDLNPHGVSPKGF